MKMTWILNMKLLKNKVVTLIIIVCVFMLITVAFSLKNSVVNQSDNYNIATSTRATAGMKKPDFANMQDVKEKKKAFMGYMLTSIRNADKEICAEKNELEKLTQSFQKNKILNPIEQTKLDVYGDYYKIKDANTIQEQLDLLDIKIGTAPTSFILAQAILESGWGSSRFARDYSNYFGLHCFKDGCGVKASGANVYLETFANATQSVLGYYHRLNTGSKFQDFREVRQKVNHGELSSTKLLDTLEDYSELEGDEYKVRLESVINHNKLDQYDDITAC